MKDINIENIWSAGFEFDVNNENIKLPEPNNKRRSKQLIDRITQTAKNEHVSFLIIAAVAVVGLLFFGYYLETAGLVAFTLLMIWKYEAEMKLFNTVQLGDDTLIYLTGVKNILQKFMKNYRIGIVILMPLVTMAAILISQGIKGVPLFETISEPIFWVALTFGSLLSILVSRLWVQLWVNTFYGRKLKELDQMIEDLEQV